MPTVEGERRDVAAGPRYMRRVNATAILATLRARPPMSVSALAAEVGLSRQAVSRSLSMLEETGLVDFCGSEMAASGLGRPAQLVRFRAEAGHVLGIDVDPQGIGTAVADLSGSIVRSRRVSGHGCPGSDDLLAEIGALLADAAIPQDSVWFASVGIPGVIDPATGVINLIPSMPGFAGDGLAVTLRDRLGCPVYVDNDIKLATEGERRAADERDGGTFVYVQWGERVGAGIVLRGRLHRGASNDAGDIGFLDLIGRPSEPTPGDAARHQVGLGPFESWVGTAELVRLAAVGHPADRALDGVIDAALAGDRAALAAVEEVARRFTFGITAMRAILDPDAIVIGGPMARLGDVLLAALRRNLAGQPLNQPRVAVSRLGEDAVIEGAIRHSLRELGLSADARKSFHPWPARVAPPGSMQPPAMAAMR